MISLTVGVLALQGGFAEHLALVRTAADTLASADLALHFRAIEVRNVPDLARCDALIIPGGESTAISLVAAQSGLLEPLRDFVKVHKKPVWGTCAGLILLSEQANATKQGGQDLLGGLAVRVHRNHFGRQIESFQADLRLPFLGDDDDDDDDDAAPFPGVFIRAPVVEEVLPHVAADADAEEAPQQGQEIAQQQRTEHQQWKKTQQQQQQQQQQRVEILAKLPGRVDKMRPGVSQASTKEDAGDIIAVRQGNVFGTSFHPELTADARIHRWWLREILRG